MLFTNPNKEAVSTRKGSSSNSPVTTLEEVPNPTYESWMVVDQLLLGWLYNSMSPEIATQVMGY